MSKASYFVAVSGAMEADQERYPHLGRPVPNSAPLWSVYRWLNPTDRTDLRWELVEEYLTRPEAGRRCYHLNREAQEEPTISPPPAPVEEIPPFKPRPEPEPFKNHQGRVQFDCPICGKTQWLWPYVARNRKTCSPRCNAIRRSRVMGAQYNIKLRKQKKSLGQ